MMGDKLGATMPEGEKMHEAAWRLRTKRFELLASNIAHADTPGYKARDIDFNAELERAMSDKNVKFPGMSRTSSRHIEGTKPADSEELLYRIPFQSSMDGNTVEMDVERVAFAENAIRTRFSMQMALGEYKDMQMLYQSLRP